MRRLLALLALSGLFLLPTDFLPAESPTRFKVVVSASNPLESMSRADLSKIFLKKITRWGSGQKIQPVDQVEKSELRIAFSKEVHEKDVAWIKAYWQKMFFSGRASAPPALSTDDEVLSYVRSNGGAIGYVSAQVPTGEGVKVVENVQ